MLHIRAGLTHLSAGIRATAIEAWVWILEVAGEEVVGGKGGWLGGLKALTAGVGWGGVDTSNGGGGGGGARAGVRAGERGGGWSNLTSSSTSAGGVARDEEERVAVLKLLVLFLRTGLVEKEGEDGEGDERGDGWLWMRKVGRWDANMLPRRADAYGYLGLFGDRKDEEGEGWRDCEERAGVFVRAGWKEVVLRGVEACKREGGELGRLGGLVGRVVREALAGRVE